MGVPDWQRATVISGRTARRLLDAAEGPLTASLDLGRNRHEVMVEAGALGLPDGQHVARGDLADAFSAPEDCIELRAGECRKVYRYDESLHKYYKLFQPFEDRPPTIVINGATMHPIVGVDPWEGTASMVAAVPRRGEQCLDTCCGLGYSAQMLAATRFEHVTTCEVDGNVLAVAAVNPWSEGLFGASNVRVLATDLREFVAGSPAGSLDCVFHDPPTVYQAGELYAGELYEEFFRVLAPGGMLYHYVGAPGARRGQDYARGVMRRLTEAGFVRVRRVPGGVLGIRPRG